MTSMMARCMSDVNLIWVIPKVSGIAYPRAVPKPPIYVTIFGKVYQVHVEEYLYKNLTYVLLDSPVFMAQSPQEPYPQRMDELTSAIYCELASTPIADYLRLHLEPKYRCRV
jgi:alpha-1,3-glucan synthase